MAAQRIKSRPLAAPTVTAAKAPPAWLLAALLALAVVALYWPALGYGFVNYDDDRYVTANPQVQNGLTLANLRWAFLNPVAENWHPLTVLSHMLVCQFCGLNPWGHHLVNVLLHAANAALVFLWLRRMTGAMWKSCMVAALFALHPLRVESVAWVAERKDVLSGFFGLLTLLDYTRYAQAQTASGGGVSCFRSRAYWFALFWFALGLMSKPMLVTWPFVLLLLDYWPLNRMAIAQSPVPRSASDGNRPLSILKLVLEKIPFFLLAATASVVTFIVQTRGAVMETVPNLSLADRGGNALVSYCRYLAKTFWPADLAVFYPHPGHWPAVDVLLAAGFLTAVSVLLFVRRRRHPGVLIGWLWFLGTLVPVIGLVQVGQQSMADRYTYLPSVGLLIAVVWGTEALTRSWRQQRTILAIAGAAALIACMGLTWKQLQYWQDSESLFRHALAVTQNNYLAHYNLGVALDDQGRNDEAAREYQAALQIRPNYARAHVNLGIDLDQAGQPDQAMSEYQQAVRADPDNVHALNNLGIALFNQGQTTNALQQFQQAVRLAPQNAGLHNSLAAALYTLGRTDDAIREFQEAIRLQPDYAEAHFNLACIEAKQGDTADAVKHFQEAIRLKPDYTAAQEQLAKILDAPGKSN